VSAPPALRVAVLGATGLVGQELIRLLERRSFPVAELIPLASERSRARHVQFRGESLPMQLASPAALARADLVLASAGGDVSRSLLPGAAAAGAVCVDNTSAFRLQPGVPLVVPEVNGHRLDDIAIDGRGAIIANPNCSTIQLVVALKPIHDEARLERVVFST
jgi:aspartate-semialdehyde dehydrogenase